MPRRSASSRRWLREHATDAYVRKAREQGYRSRAAFKLLALQQRDRLLRPGQTVLDLGAAPGGWSQIAAELVGPAGCVVASDILDMEPLPGVTLIRGDFHDEAVLARVLEALPGGRADLVLSDMAPNMSGCRDVDQPRAMLLAELAADCAARSLDNRGEFLVKVFQGEGFDPYVADLRTRFERVLIRKPDASRGRSREVYVLCRGYRV